MFLARLQPGMPPQVYKLNGRLFFEPRAWSFVSYRRGGCAIHYTRAQAIRLAQRQLERPRVVAVG